MNQAYELENYVRKSGRVPVDDWLADMNPQARVKIRSKVNRLRYGNFSDCEPVGKGLSELKINYGPGFRVYFGHKNMKILLLLCGGDKSSQSSDIRKAHELWDEFKNRSKGERE